MRTLHLSARLVSRLAARAMLALLALVALATPAGATTTVLADDQYKWFYWLGVLLGLLLIVAIVGVGVGYVLRVMLPRARGRRVQ
jgi:hypothetical protein